MSRTLYTCPMCRSIVVKAGECDECKKTLVRPAKLVRLSMLFDDPELAPSVSVVVGQQRYTPGMLLRMIAEHVSKHLNDDGSWIK